MRTLKPVIGPTMCATCRFYAGHQPDPAAGECRLDRPQMGAATREAIWPLVQDTAFCGEYERQHSAERMGLTP